MTPDDKLYGYVGVKSGKLYTRLSDSPLVAKAFLRAFLKYEPSKEGTTIFRTDKEIEALMGKFRLATYRIIADG